MPSHCIRRWLQLNESKQEDSTTSNDEMQAMSRDDIVPFNAEAALAVDPDEFRAAMSVVPGPVAVVSTLVGGKAHGTTVSAFCSVSIAPPLILVVLDMTSDSLRALQLGSGFGVNLMSKGMEPVARACAGKGPDKLDSVSWTMRSGVPKIQGAAIWLACTVHALTESGDHVIVSGLVIDADVTGAESLVYYKRAMHVIG